MVIDLTPYQRRPHLIKNLAFLLYPEALAVLEVYNLMDYQGVKSNHLGLSMALSINGNRPEQSKNIGEIMRTLNIGDGHPGRPPDPSLQVKTRDAEKEKGVVGADL